jgi:hypothetical protein
MRQISAIVLAALLGVTLSLDTADYIKEQNTLANEVCFIKSGLTAFDLRPLAKRDDQSNNAEDYKLKLSNDVYGPGAQLIFNICQYTKDPVNGLTYAYIQTTGGAQTKLTD